MTGAPGPLEDLAEDRLDRATTIPSPRPPKPKRARPKKREFWFTIQRLGMPENCRERIWKVDAKGVQDAIELGRRAIPESWHDRVRVSATKGDPYGSWNLRTGLLVD